MPDLFWLADVGRGSVSALWLPVAAWSAVALVTEAALRLGRTRAALALPVRGAVLAALPLAVAVPAALSALAPEAATTVSAFTPDALLWLPEVSIGSPTPVDAAPTGPPLLDVLLGLALLGAGLAALVQLIRLGVALAMVGRSTHALPAAGPDPQAAVDAARQRLGVARAVAAAEAPPGAAPFTVGWRRPLVALPPDLDAEAREVAAVHEVAHVRRADYAWHVAQRAVVSVFAAHPLVWALGRGLDRERAADAAVLGACPGRRRAYADLLFSYAALPAPPLALGAARGSSSLKSRIDAMARPLSPARTHRLGQLGQLAGLLILTLTVVGAAGMAPRTSPETLPFVTQTDGAVRADTTDEVYEVAEVQPELIGGLAGLQERLTYPELQRRAGVEGTAILQFIVEKDGSVGELEVIRSSGNDGLDQAAATAVRDARFQPGRQRGEPVRVRFAVPVTFRVGDAEAPAEREPGLRPTVGDLRIFEVAEVQPTLIGGLAGLQERVVYPPLAREAGIEGQVVVQFIVNEEGRVQDAVVLRSPDDMLSEAALQAVRGSRFQPGRQRGEAVKVRFAVPVTFRLAGGDGEHRGSRLDGPGEGRLFAPFVFETGPVARIDFDYEREIATYVLRDDAPAGTADRIAQDLRRDAQRLDEIRARGLDPVWLAWEGAVIRQPGRTDVVIDLAAARGN